MNLNSNYKICSKTIMDTSDPLIKFDESGICNYWYDYQEKSKVILLDDELRKKKFNEIISNIKNSGKSQDYDCLIGLSGGVDSSYITYLAGEIGLRPLVVHFDNGWNSELAVNNIEKLISKYDFDLYTLVVDWEEFKDIQLSVFKSSVPNIEIVTDHAIIATLYKIAYKYNIKYLLSGSNIVTEGILPPAWGYDASDFYHIKQIHNKFGAKKINTFPRMTLPRYFFYNVFGGLKKINLLNYIDYNKDSAIDTLKNNVGWEYYGGKHYESIFTQFFQAYVLPQKFGFDKRRAHLSSLICSGQITRNQAIKELEKPLYGPKLLMEHKAYVIKKWGITETEFDSIMSSQPLQHDIYPSNRYWISLALKIKNLIKF